MIMQETLTTAKTCTCMHICKEDKNENVRTANKGHKTEKECAYVFGQIKMKGQSFDGKCIATYFSPISVPVSSCSDRITWA